MDAKREFDQCSKLIKSEMARFEQERIDDFKEALQAFLSGMISRQKEVSGTRQLASKRINELLQLIGTWENYQQMLLKRVAVQ